MGRSSLTDFVALTAVFGWAGINSFVTPYAEFVAGFMVKFEMLRRAFVAVLAGEYETMQTVVEVDITVVGRELHSVCACGCQTY